MNNTCACIRITTTAACPQANPSIWSSAVKQSGERGEGGNVTPPMGGQGRAKGGSEPNEIGGYLRTDPAPKPAVEGSRCVYIERLSPRKDDASGPHLGQINLFHDWWEQQQRCLAAILSETNSLTSQINKVRLQCVQCWCAAK
ncbi:hypothetical protein BHE74_00038839 [Ensete ventricosum]|nr:hypothetical protein BHE74_00038839 [Ensete ventricosum]